MFIQHFQMTDHPFCEHPPVEHLLADERMTQALARLDYFTQVGLVAAIMGITGVGKSSLFRLFLQRLNLTRFHPVYVHLTHLRPSSLLKVILSALGEDAPARGKERLFLRILDHANSSEQTTLFLIDEAHLIPPDALVDLRLLVSSALDSAPKIKIVLSGQDGLSHNLHLPHLRDLLHRVSVFFHLKPLSPAQTSAYIDFRLQQVAASPNLFDPQAKAVIHQFSGGIPRQINSLATACLIHATTQNLLTITEDLVNQTLSEIKLP